MQAQLSVDELSRTATFAAGVARDMKSKAIEYLHAMRTGNVSK